MADWPLYGWTDDVRPALAAARAAGRASVLATLHAVVGGSPRAAGSQMLVEGGELHGFLSGGCIEGDVAARAAQVLATGEPQRLVYGEGGPFADIRLVCGGRIEVLLEPIAPDDVATGALLDAARTRRTALWASDGVSRLCLAAEDVAPACGAEDARGRALAILAREEGAAVVSVAGGAAVALRRPPALRVAVVGRDPVALAIARLAGESGFEVHLIRPKGPAAPPPLAGVAYHRGGAGDTLRALALDPWTSVAVATHALEEDEEALLAALPSPAAYVGVLGARRRLPERLARLRRLGVAPEALERLHAPIGLDLGGGKAPFEIAVAVLAEIMAEAARRRPSLALSL